MNENNVPGTQAGQKPESSETYRMLQGYESLNRLACELLEKGTESNEVLVTTLEGRWLGTGAQDPALSEIQIRLKDRLEAFVKQRITDAPRLNMKVLLFDNPGRIRDPWQISLLARSGADVRFIRTTSRLRLILVGPEVLLAASTHSSPDTIVNVGLYYRAPSSDSIVVTTIRTIFIKYFDKGVPVEVTPYGKIARFMLAKREFRHSFSSISLKDWILLAVGGIFGIFSE